MPLPKITRFVPSIEGQKLHERLKTTNVGDLVLYRELSILIGRNVQKEARAVLDRVRGRLRRHDRILFGTVTDHGLKRLNDGECATSGETGIRTIRRTCGRMVENVSCANYDALTNAERVKHNTALSIAGAIASVTVPGGLMQVESRVREANNSLSVSRTLEAFR